MVFDAILLGDLTRVATESDVRWAPWADGPDDAGGGRGACGQGAFVGASDPSPGLNGAGSPMEYVRVREDAERFVVWRAQHKGCPVMPAEEMQLVIGEDYDAHFFRVRGLPRGAWVPDVPAGRRGCATG